MSTKILDNNGLSHFWTRLKEGYWVGTTEEFNNLQTNLREGTIVHLTDDSSEVDSYIVSVRQDIEGNIVFLMSDGTEITIGNSGSYHTGTLFEGTIGSSQYTSTVKYVRNDATVTIYFDLEGSSSYDNFYFDNLLPAEFRPNSRITSLVAESMNNFNNIIIDPNGRVGCTSNTKNYNIKTAITYVLIATQ